MSTIAYLAPELTALAATFVYEELLELEANGLKVVPISVHKAKQLVTGQPELLDRTHYIYSRPKLAALTETMKGIFDSRMSQATSIRWLLDDIFETGILHFDSWKLVYQYFAGVRVARILTANHCKHLHIHFAHVPAQIGMYAAAMAGIPFTITAHANDIFQRGFLLRKKASRSKALFTISEYNRQHLKGLGVPADKLEIIRCGVAAEGRCATRSYMQQATYEIGSMGRLVEKKGFDVLIEAVALLRNKPYEIRLTIAGSGPLATDLENLAQRLGLASQVTFAGNLSRKHVHKWLYRLDLFVLACRTDQNGDMDGIPVALMEAMSQGTPVISTRLSGIPELIIEEKTGVLAKPNDAVDLAQAIDRFLSTPTAREEAALAAVAQVMDEFSRAANIEKLISHFNVGALV
jgi:glycosyltransferase involved in cell wall biosynthesis